MASYVESASPRTPATATSAGASPPPKLLDRLRDHLRTRHYSIRTEATYVDWARRFILFHGKRHPQEMGAAEVEAFLTHLAVARQVSASTQNQAKAAILYLYKQVLGIDLPWLDEVVQAKTPKRLPVVLTASEVRELLLHMQGTTGLITQLLYGTGMRLSEALLWITVLLGSCWRGFSCAAAWQRTTTAHALGGRGADGDRLRRQVQQLVSLPHLDLGWPVGNVALPSASVLAARHSIVEVVQRLPAIAHLKPKRPSIQRPPRHAAVDGPIWQTNCCCRLPSPA